MTSLAIRPSVTSEINSCHRPAGTVQGLYDVGVPIHVLGEPMDQEYVPRTIA